MTVLFRNAAGAGIFEAEMDVIPSKDSTVMIGEELYAIMFIRFEFISTGRGGTYYQQVILTVVKA